MAIIFEDICYHAISLSHILCTSGTTKGGRPNAALLFGFTPLLTTVQVLLRLLCGRSLPPTSDRPAPVHLAVYFALRRAGVQIAHPAGTRMTAHTPLLHSSDRTNRADTSKHRGAVASQLLFGGISPAKPFRAGYTTRRNYRLCPIPIAAPAAVGTIFENVIRACTS